MSQFSHLLIFSLYITLTLSSSSSDELDTLLQIKTSLDPETRFLTSWTGSDPCSSGSFGGVACNEKGHVANISLQGMGLSGKIPAAIGGLKSLTGLYLHFNALKGTIPEEIASLTQLTDLYLNVNDLSGDIPAQVGDMVNLQVLQLCYNKLTGSIPTQLGSLKKLSVLALQYNRITGAIPASLGDLELLTRLDLSFNNLFGSIPVKVANAPSLKTLDVQNNSLSGNVPTALMKLKNGFRYENNQNLCGVGYSDLKACTTFNSTIPNTPDPSKRKPEPVDFQHNPNEPRQSKALVFGVVFGVIGLVVAITVTGFITVLYYRRQKQKIGNSLDTSDKRVSTDDQVKECNGKGISSLMSLEYSTGWDPLAKGQNSNNNFSQEVFESFMLNLEDIERATQCFSEMNVLGKSKFSVVYKGILRDGSVVAIKSIAKTSCKSDETEFLKGLKVLSMLKHENLVRLRGFCCSIGRGECFLVHEFVPNGNLSRYLDVEKDGDEEVLEWSIRVSIIIGVAKGISYLHENKPAIVHQNISAEKVLIDHWYNPSLSDSGLHKLLTKDIVFSKLKASAAMGYLAPEYITTGQFTEKSDVYAFGKIVFQILTGKTQIAKSALADAESSKVEDLIDPNLEGRFVESEAVELCRIALSCTNKAPSSRPSMKDVIQELSKIVKGS